MSKMTLATMVAAVAVGGALTVPAMTAASAAPVPVQLQPWSGANHPGQPDPRDPHHNDWHCDQHGFWHNTQGDHMGHRDNRCKPW